MLVKIADLITEEQMENKPASIRVDFFNVENINVRFDGAFADVIGLGADMYCAIVETVITKELMDNLIEDECSILKENYADAIEGYAYLDFAIDEDSNITSNMRGKTLQLAMGYYEFMYQVTEHYNISIEEYYKHIKSNYQNWKKSDKKKIFDDALKTQKE